jgi:hypothetical protein
MIVTETDIEVLKARIVKGITLVNELHQKSCLPETTGEEFKKLVKQIDDYTAKLRLLVSMLNVQGFTGCVFGECKWSDKFICLVCTK